MNRIDFSHCVGLTLTGGRAMYDDSVDVSQTWGDNPKALPSVWADNTVLSKAVLFLILSHCLIGLRTEDSVSLNTEFLLQESYVLSLVTQFKCCHISY